MQRRRLVALSGLSVLAGVSGCSRVFRRVSASPRTPEGMTVETEQWADGHIRSGGRERPFAVVATSPSEATGELAVLRTNREAYDPIEFVEQTDFDSSSLVLVEWMGASSSASLELRRIERRDYGVHVEADVVESDGTSASDVSAHSLFVRVTDEREDDPEKATVHVAE